MNRSAGLVVVTVGTDHHPFHRLTSWTEKWARTRPDIDVIVQCGNAAPPRGVTRAQPLVPYEELRGLMAAATVVVSHGGPATIADIRSVGRLPLVVPRRPELGEHIDDHQLRFSRRMAEAGLIRLIADASAFAQELDEAVRNPSRVLIEAANTELSSAVARFSELVGGLPPRRRRLRRSLRGAEAGS